MTEPNLEVEEDYYLVPLLARLEDLTKKILEVEVQCKRNDRYIPPQERRQSKDNDSKCINDTLLIILLKVNKHDKVLEELKENVEVLNKIIVSHSRSIQIIRSLMGQVLPHLYPKQKDGLPSDTMANPQKWGLCVDLCCDTMLNKALFGRQHKTLYYFISLLLNNYVLIMQSEVWKVFAKCRLAS